MKTHKQIVLTLGLLVLALLMGGCSKPWSVNALGVGDAVCNSNVRVDIVGVNSYEKENWLAVSLEDYWIGKSPLRKDALAQGYLTTKTFSPGEDQCVLVVTEKDPAWKKWSKEKQATHVVVLIDKIPEGGTWRFVLPLKPACWQGDFWDKTKRLYKKRIKNNQIIVNVLESGIAPVTIPVEDCQ
jgi:hypothetical protein